MVLWHLAYYVSTAAAIGFPIWYYFRTRDLVSFGIIFPAWYVLYSLVGPLALIHEETFDNITSVHRLLFVVYSFSDEPYVYEAHLYFLIFYVFWIIAYLRTMPRESKEPAERARMLSEEVRTIPGIGVLLPIALGLLLFLAFYLQVQYGSPFAAPYSAGETDVNRGTLAAGPLLAFAVGCAVTTCCVAVGFVPYQVRNPLLASLRIPALCAVIAGYMLWSVTLGNRSQLLAFIVGITVLYGLLHRRIRATWRIIALGMGGLVAMFVVGQLRHAEINDYGYAIQRGVLDGNLLVNSLLTVESFAAYASMLFVVASNTPPLWGESFLWMPVSFFPRSVMPWRPETTFFYSEYMQRAGLTGEKLGFTCHYVADWQANFPIVGLVVGGVVTGWLMGQIEKRAKASQGLFWMVLFALLCGYMPTLFRSGVENLRNLVYVCVVPPLVLLVLPRYTGLFSRVR